MNRGEKPYHTLERDLANLAKGLNKFMAKLQAREWEKSLDISNALVAESFRSVTKGSAHCIISADPRQHPIKDENFILNIKRRLIGIPVIPQPNHTCRLCGKYVDNQLEHPQACKKIGRNTVHHNVCSKVANIVTQLLKNSSTSVRTEQKIAIHLKPGQSVERPRSDLTISNPITNFKQEVDFTFCIVQENGRHDKPTVELAEERKNNHYQARYNFPSNVELVPAAIDTLGRWGESLSTWVKKMAKLGSTSHKNYAYNVHRLRTTIAVAHANALGDQMCSYLRYGNLR